MLSFIYPSYALYTWIISEIISEYGASKLPLLFIQMAFIYNIFLILIFLLVFSCVFFITSIFQFSKTTPRLLNKKHTFYIVLVQFLPFGYLFVASILAYRYSFLRGVCIYFLSIIPSIVLFGIYFWYRYIP